MKSEMNFVGNQAANNKYRQPSTTAGAWKGEIIHTDTPFPMKSTTGKKWAKFKAGLKLVLCGSRDSGVIETSTLRRVAGLGVHVIKVYPYARCYLKGFFNAIEGFREGRDMDGWRLANAVTEVQLLEVEFCSDAQVREGYPFLTRITEELILHTEALLRFFVSETPLTLPLRPNIGAAFRECRHPHAISALYFQIRILDNRPESFSGSIGSKVSKLVGICRAQG